VATLICQGGGITYLFPFHNQVGWAQPFPGQTKERDELASLSVGEKEETVLPMTSRLPEVKKKRKRRNDFYHFGGKGRWAFAIVCGKEDCSPTSRSRERRALVMF